MQVSKTLPIGAAFVLAVTLGAAGCGDDPEPADTKVYTKKDASALKREGSAANEEEVRRREEEARKAAERNRAVKELLKYESDLDKAEDELAMAEAIEQIARFGEHAGGYADRIAGLLDHEETDVRAAAVRALSSIRGAAARKEVEARLKDEDERVRAAALQAWRKAGIADLAPVMPLLEDIDTAVQIEAVKTIIATKPPASVVRDLARRAPDLDGPAARRVLAFALENAAAVADLDGVLIKLCDHPEPRTRVEAVQAAGALEARRYPVARKLVQLLGDDPDERVRRRAHEVLKSWAGGAGPAYDPAADAEARDAAAEAWSTHIESNRALFGA